VKGQFRRLCKSSETIVKGLMGAEARCRGGLAMAGISAALFGENYATAGARIWDRGFTRVGEAV